MSQRDTRPIVIVVQNGRWDAFAQIPPTKRDQWLLSLIHKAGGINESVPDGRYHFNARGNKLLAKIELTPIEE